VHVYRISFRALSLIILPCRTDRMSPTPYRADVSIWERVQENLTLFQHPRCERHGQLVLWDSNHYDYLWLTDAHGKNPQY
jgi:hypothetical protein